MHWAVDLTALIAWRWKMEKRAFLPVHFTVGEKFVSSNKKTRCHLLAAGVTSEADGTRAVNNGLKT